MRTLVAGWFSFEGMGATAGDLLSRDLACEWLRCAGHDVDVAHAAPFPGGVDWREVPPDGYASVVFVCGPMGNGPPVDEFLARFAGSRLIGLNLSMLDPLDAWNPFDLLIERDSSARSRPDISFAAPTAAVPVVGVILVHPQQEYSRALHAVAHEAIDGLLRSRDVAAIPIDTRLDENAGMLRSPAAVESAIAHMDAVITTRLHGMVLAIKNGVPALVIDPVAGGAKVIEQARAIGWSPAFTADSLDERTLSAALDYCLSSRGRTDAVACRETAVAAVRDTRDQFIAAVAAKAEV